MTANPEITQQGAIAGPPGPARKNVMDRFIDSIEWIAAFFVGIVALNTFLAVFMRKFFAVTVPDYYNFGQFMLGILIFWGIAATSYRGGHITVDLIWANVGPKYQRWIDVFATLVLLFVVAVQTWTLFDKVRGTYNDNVLTFEMHMPTWPFFAVAWAGDVSAVLLIAIRTYRLIFYPDLMHDPKIKTVE
jgi:TRAP-type C4-dicarboxylate transport system permease small subunit